MLKWEFKVPETIPKNNQTNRDKINERKKENDREYREKINIR